MLLEQVAGVLPRGHQEWEKVTRYYNLVAEEASDQERIKTKFFSLVGTRKPTGKHTKPEQITRAVHISNLIDEKVFAGCTGGDELDVDAVDVFEQGASGGDRSTESSSSSSSSSPPTSALSAPSTASLPPSSFASARTAAMKKAKVGTDITGAAHYLGQSISDALKQMSESNAAIQREEILLRREEMQRMERQREQEMQLRREEM
jgi:hypothetical protein